RECEKGENDDQPCDAKHRNLDKIVEEVDRPDQLLRLQEQRPGRLETGSGEPPRHQQILGADRAAARGQAKSGERAKDDVGQRRKAVQYQREGADIENLLEKLADDIIFAAERPEQTGERDVDADQDRGQESHIAAEQPEAAVYVGDERLHELIYDVHIVHVRGTPWE